MYDSSYQEIKADIRDDLNQLAERFVIIGYRLKKIRDEKLYEIDGYRTITEFASKEYNLSQTATSRFIAINDKYSIEGSSPKLLPQFEGYGYSKLSEMLTMSDEEMKLVTVQTTRAEIREIKDTKKEAETANYAPAHNAESIENTQSEVHFDTIKNYIIPDAEKLIIEFFKPKTGREMLKELSVLFSKDMETKEREVKAAEIINPSGHFLFRNKLTILILEEDHIKYSDFVKTKGTTIEYRYSDIIHDLINVFDFGSRDPWVAFYGEPEPDPEPVKPKEPEKKEPVKKDVKTQPAAKPESKKPEKPVVTQSKQPKLEKKDTEDEDEGEEETEGQEQEEELQRQMQMEDYPETLPGEGTEPEIVEADIIQTTLSDHCKYCEDIGYMIFNANNCMIGISGNDELIVRTEKEEHFIIINYCPICGRKLKGKH